MRKIVSNSRPLLIHIAEKDDYYFGRYLGSFRSVKEPRHKKAGKTTTDRKGPVKQNIMSVKLTNKMSVKLTNKMSVKLTNKMSVK
jgi:hypothetical protein